jgi:hypothetical protein
MARIATCCTCQRKFPCLSVRRMYCEPCLYARRLQAKRDRNAKRAVGLTITCQQCAAVVPVSPLSRRKVCAACAEQRVRERKGLKSPARPPAESCRGCNVPFATVSSRRQYCTACIVERDREARRRYQARVIREQAQQTCVSKCRCGRGLHDDDATLCSRCQDIAFYRIYRNPERAEVIPDAVDPGRSARVAEFARRAELGLPLFGGAA